MKTLITLALAVALAACSPSVAEGIHELADQEVDAGCGQCQLGLEGDGCDLAVRVDGETYFVDGTDIDDHGDAHADDGLCNTLRRAKISGEIVDGRVEASSFELVDE